MEKKDFKFELKAVNEDGTFEGWLSVYGVVDLGNDVVEKGSMTKTIKEQGGVVPMLWGHDPHTPLGSLDLTDGEYGLAVKGEFFLDASEKARELHAMSKRYLAKGRPMGLSIGYETIRKDVKKGIRYLKELKLHEGSLTLFPMLPAAQMTSIKSLDGEQKDDFIQVLNRAQVYVMRGLMIEALRGSLDSIVYQYYGEEKLDAAGKFAASEDSIDQFKAAYLAHLPTLLELWGEKEMAPDEAKAGRRISATSRAQIEEAITKLQALLTEDAATSAEEADAGKSIARTPPENSTTPEVVPDAHLLLSVLDRFTFKRTPLTWN